MRRQVGPEEVEQSLEPVRPQQTRRATAEVERVEAAHVVRRPLPLPLGGDAVHEAVEPAGGRHPGPPAGRDGHRHGGELAVVALGAAEGHVYVDVPYGALERSAACCARRATSAGSAFAAPGRAHVVGIQKKRLPSRSSSTTPPFFTMTRREATLPAQQSTRAGSMPRAAASGSAAASMAVA